MKLFKATFLHCINFEGDLDLESFKAELESFGLKIIDSRVMTRSPGETFLTVHGTKEQFEKHFSQDNGDWGYSWEDHVDCISLKVLPESHQVHPHLKEIGDKWRELKGKKPSLNKEVLDQMTGHLIGTEIIRTIHLKNSKTGEWSYEEVPCTISSCRKGIDGITVDLKFVHPLNGKKSSTVIFI